MTPHPPPVVPRILVMGVSASGKSTVGELVAQRLDLPFVDGDDLHPEANVEKMRSGIPLTDEDRWPWLDAVGRVLQEHEHGVVVACSALRRSYRDRIRRHAPEVCIVHLHGTPELLASRASDREGHFMPPRLLESQIETLEVPGDDEDAVITDVARPVTDIADAVLDALDLNAVGGR